ncbi:aminotransferase [Polymorphobacter glacialis]|uniref:Aminotransferase n=1 Tax=Sandarakinorhabdus glacialis TaxID=1614636 RepID=A0A917E9P7_9SPHN|nr:DegT/DnrJ/EryC1/StrS family aminotransferase [Polymorphobacter glacialis]GGE14497.1 aminotransferase [Polymorphobacter glacialis]
MRAETVLQGTGSPGQAPLLAIPASRWPVHDEDEIEAVVAVLRSGRVNALHHGDEVRAFEAGFAALSNQPHAIAMANGTVTLEIALRALGIGAGDEVVVTPRSFVASASVVVAVGATPVFADVDPHSQGIAAAGIAAVLTPRTRAILPVHVAGWPCDMDAIMALARDNDLRVVEDCAQAHGARLGGRPVGSFGDAASFSFCTDKIISTGGEGGMLVLRDAEVHARAWSLKDHGKQLAAPQPPGPQFRWLHGSFGSNHRMTEMQAAIGRRQLARLPATLAARQARADTLDAALGNLAALRLTVPEPDIEHARYKYYAFIRPKLLRAGWDRDRIVKTAMAQGLPCQAGICPEIYREQAFVAAGLAPPQRLPMARLLGETSLMLPIDPTLSTDDVALIGRRLAAIINEGTA